MILELLAHRTPPSCVAANILTVSKMILPHANIVVELPSVSFVRKSRSTLSFLTKLLAAYQLAKADKLLEHHSDGTMRRQISMNNSIVRIASGGGFRTVTLNSAILSVDETSEMLCQAILRTFKEGREMLETWHEVTVREYPNRPDLILLLPKAGKLLVAKLAMGGWLMTDTCNPARKFRRLLMKAISEVAEKEGMSADEIQIYEAGENAFSH